MNLGKLAIIGVYLYIAFILGQMLWSSGFLQKTYAFITGEVNKYKERKKQGKSWLRF